MIVGMVLSGFVPAGCRQPPPAVTTNSALLEGERGHDQVLDSSQRDTIERAMIHAADEARAHDVSGSASGAIGRGLRWSDVPLAAATACDEREVELAIVSVESTSNQHRFVLVSVDNRPGELIVSRSHDERVYDATARVGWNGDETDRAQRLLEAFDRAMKAYGRKRGFIDGDQVLE